MSDKSAIEWTDATWNPIVGCSVVSPGCTNCYAMQMAWRIEKMHGAAGTHTHYRGTTTKVKRQGLWTGKVALATDKIISAPLRWTRGRRIFVNSMGDLFHESIPDEWIDRVFAVMALCPQHTFQVLTKRSARMRSYMDRNEIRDCALRANCGWPLQNVWLGVSAERQQEADERIPLLLQTAAAARFVSLEPLLGPIDLTRVTCGHPKQGPVNVLGSKGACPSWQDENGYHHFLVNDGLDWVIVGGESGPRARPMHPDWARSLRNQCKTAGVPFFYKQWGAWAPGTFCGSTRILFMYPNGTGGKFSAAGTTELGHIGKAAAGRLLDGVEHNGFPARAP